jgi:hypothetical protein
MNEVTEVVTSPSAELLELQAALARECSLQRELGRGGMGVNYLARDVQLDRDAAIKVQEVEEDAAGRKLVAGRRPTPA